MSNDTGTPRPGLADEALSDYILRHIDPEGSYLHALYRDTNLRLLYPRMASGHLQGRLLKMLVRMVRPRQVLEIGTYSGYSALCIAEGLEPGATLHTIEVNDEQEDFTRPWLEQSAYADRIRFYIGDALEVVPRLGLTFDLAFVDGDKRRYTDYYEMLLPRLASGGYLLASETLAAKSLSVRIAAVTGGTETFFMCHDGTYSFKTRCEPNNSRQRTENPELPGR